MINVEVKAKSSEASSSVIRRFSKRVQGSGIMKKVRRIRYHSRPESKFIRKRKTLRGIKRRKETEKLIKLGKLPENTRRGF